MLPLRAWIDGYLPVLGKRCDATRKPKESKAAKKAKKLQDKRSNKGKRW